MANKNKQNVVKGKVAAAQVLGQIMALTSTSTTVGFVNDDFIMNRHTFRTVARTHIKWVKFRRTEAFTDSIDAPFKAIGKGIHFIEGRAYQDQVTRIFRLYQKRRAHGFMEL